MVKIFFLFFGFLLFPLYSQVQQEWVRTYDGYGTGIESKPNIIIDSQGNTFIVANSEGFSVINLIIIKYNSNGTKIWEISIGRGSYQEINPIGLDGQGNLYVLIKKYNQQNSNRDIGLIKLSQSGVILWEQEYNGTYNGDDNPFDLYVDVAGNSYICGSTNSYNNGLDGIVLKYSSGGVLLWQKRYNGIGNHNDEFLKIYVDGNGIVYTCGYSYSDGSNYDGIVLKYSQTGAQQWSSRYFKPGNNNETARDIKVDLSGNVFITGSTYNFINDNNFTVKYSPQGLVVWERSFNPGTQSSSLKNIEMDNQGNVYVFGNISNSNNDMLLVKYSSGGIELWNSVYNSPYNKDDFASMMKLLPNGDICIIGTIAKYGFSDSTDICALKYNSTGVLQWVNTYNNPNNGNDRGETIAIDQSSNIVCAGIIDINLFDIYTIKYNLIGNLIWQNRFNGKGQNDDWASDIFVAGSNVFVGGISKEDSVGWGFTVINYTTGGSEIWKYHHPRQLNPNSELKMVKDSNGDIYMAGSEYSEGKLLVIKLNQQGVLQWETVIPVFLQGCSFKSFASDPSGNLYLCGYGSDSLSISGTAIIKINNSGTTQWIRKFNGFGVTGCFPVAISANEGGCYVTGTSESDIYALKYSYGGNLDWSIRYGVANQYEEPSAIINDNSGNVYIACNTFVTNNDMLTLKYNSSGELLWSKIYNSPNDGNDVANDIGIDNSGNIIIAGVTGINDVKFTAVKYNPNGQLLWASVFEASSNSSQVNDMAIDNYNNVYLTGTAFNFGSKRDIPIVKFNQLGNVVWSVVYNNNLNYSDVANSIAISNTDVYVAGFYNDISTLGAFLTIKYSQPIGITPITNEVPVDFYLNQNYPNPFNPVTKIKFGLPLSSNVKLSLYSITGELVSEKLNNYLSAGSYEIEINSNSMASGVYFYKLEAGSYKESKKMIIVK